MDAIIGHKKITNFLKRNIEADSVSQSYIFSGPEGVGKFLVAKKFARDINGDKEMAIEEDLIILRPEEDETKGIVKKRDIKIESIRELQHKLSITTSGRRKKIAIIDEADRLTVSSQNALLKTLEEPPQNSVIILIVKDKAHLLPTIISRCQNIIFGILSNEEMMEIILADNSQKEEIIFFSCGRPGWARHFIEDETAFFEKKENLKNFKALLLADVNDRFIQAENLSKNLPKLIEMMDLWITILREIIFGNRFGISIGKEKALELISKIEKSQSALRETNANARLVLENLLLNF